MDYNSTFVAFYDGEWLNGKPNGFGKCVYESGGSYEGDWVNGERHGNGKMSWPKQHESYSGFWKNGKQVNISSPYSCVCIMYQLLALSNLTRFL